MARSIRHPGPPAAKRIRTVEADIHPLRLRLRKGLSVNDAVTTALVEAGFESGYVELAGLSLDPLRYVIPAASPDAAHAAWYSATHAPAGTATIERAGAIVGLRDGSPFLHCHGIWRHADGARRMGHLLPLDAVVAEEIEVPAWGVAGACFEVQDDAETNFRLFAPVARPGKTTSPAGERGLLCTVRPNEEIAGAIVVACHRHGFADARVLGIGSLVGAGFADGGQVESFATEVLISGGTVRSGETTLEIAIVDMGGVITEGRLAGPNPVCVTFELLILEERT
jgi:predicted DNA-binding protein with PD1-like motif